METNVLGLIGTLLALLVPTAFLIILYVQTASRESK